MRNRILGAAALAVTLTLAGAGPALADPGPTDAPLIQVPLDLGAHVCGNSILDILPVLSPVNAVVCENDS
jgi:hypothetical protein